MIDKCDQCGTPTIPMDPTGRREANCDCEDMPLCGCGCGKRIGGDYFESAKYGPMCGECFERHMIDVELGLDSEEE